MGFFEHQAPPRCHLTATISFSFSARSMFYKFESREHQGFLSRARPLIQSRAPPPRRSSLATVISLFPYHTHTRLARLLFSHSLHCTSNNSHAALFGGPLHDGVTIPHDLSPKERDGRSRLDVANSKCDLSVVRRRS